MMTSADCRLLCVVRAGERYFKRSLKKKKLASPDLSIFKPVQATRSRCECKICEIAREIPVKIYGKVAKKVPGKF